MFRPEISICEGPILLLAAIQVTAQGHGVAYTCYQSGVIIAGRLGDSLSLPKFRKSLHDRLEKSGWQQTVGVAARLIWYLPQVVTWPAKDIDIVEHNPGRIAIKTKVLCYTRRDLDGRFLIGMPAMCNRHNSYERRLPFALLYRHDDRARPGLATIHMANSRLVAP